MLAAGGDGEIAGRDVSDPVLQHVWSANGIRLLGDGVPGGDVAAARTQIARWDEWYPFWASRGDAYEKLARAALARGRRQSAGELFWQACLSYHYAQFLWFHDPANREAGQMRKTALYREGAPLFAMPAERFDLAFEGFSIPGYLRLPPQRSGPVPVVLVLGGLESTKEESYLFENRCLARGLATCSFDGPGQGEMYFQAKMRSDFHRFASAVVDWLQAHPEIDGDRVGVVGRSLGGFYAVHTAAHEPRIKACVAWGVLFYLSYYDSMGEPSRSGFAYVAGYDDPVAAAPHLTKTLDLSGQAERVRCPIYALHGALDRLIPATQVDRLRAALAGHPDAEFDIPADGDHCCHNLYHVVRPRMADWLAERLGGRV
ncbi:MAG: alpha/beta hydrolase family protein [Xanthobacteraceae bacterium]